jgi:hypothetical protein
VWGGLHGFYLAIERLLLGSKPGERPWTSALAWLRSFFVFLLVTITWVPFRSPDWQTTSIVLSKLFFIGKGYNLEWYFSWALLFVPLILIGGWIVRRFEWKWPIFSIRESYTPAFMLLEILVVFFFSPLNSSPFIYFQF